MPRFYYFLLLTAMVLTNFACQPTAEHTPTEVRIRLAGEPDGLNPLLIRNAYSSQLVKHIFQPLMEFDPVSLELEPVLAVGAPEKEMLAEGPFQGGVAYTFEIRKEASWGNGHPVTARDYLFTLKNIFNPQLPNFFRSYLSFLRTVELDPDNPRRFTVIIDRPYFMAEVICANIELLPEYFFDPEQSLDAIEISNLVQPEKAETFRQNVVLTSLAEKMKRAHQYRDSLVVPGSGAYQVESWQPGQSLRLVKKENWWGDALQEPQFLARPTVLNYLIIPDANSAISMLKNQKLDVMSGIPVRQFKELQKVDYLAQSYHWSSPPQLSYIYIALNRENLKLEDKRVRRALAHLLPVEEIIEKVWYGLAQTTIGPFSPQSEYYHQGLKPVAYSVEDARRLLKEAGWEDSNGDGVVDRKVAGQQVEMILPLEVSAGNDEGHAVALLFQDRAKKAGIEIEIKILEFGALAERLRNRSFAMTFSKRSFAPGENDPSQTWYAGGDLNSGSNYSGFGNAASDAIIDSLRQSLDRTERYRFYQQLQEMIYEDQPVIFVAVPQSTIAIRQAYSAQTSSRWPGYFPERFQMK